MERIWEQWKESFAAIESEELGRVNHVILCTLCNCSGIAAARTQASWGQLVGDIFLIYIFVSKFSVCPSQVLVTVSTVSPDFPLSPAEAVLCPPVICLTISKQTQRAQYNSTQSWARISSWQPSKRLLLISTFLRVCLKSVRTFASQVAM